MASPGKKIQNVGPPLTVIPGMKIPLVPGFGFLCQNLARRGNTQFLTEILSKYPIGRSTTFNR